MSVHENICFADQMHFVLSPNTVIWLRDEQMMIIRSNFIRYKLSQKKKKSTVYLYLCISHNCLCV